VISFQRSGWFLIRHSPVTIPDNKKESERDAV